MGKYLPILHAFGICMGGHVCPGLVRWPGRLGPRSGREICSPWCRDSGTPPIIPLRAVKPEVQQIKVMKNMAHMEAWNSMLSAMISTRRLAMAPGDPYLPHIRFYLMPIWAGFQA